VVPRRWTLWRARRHGIVLLDIHMPGMDGFELARAIRQEEQARDLPRTTLVAVTANALKGEAERCYAAGMDGFLAKPVTLDGLSRMLGALAARPSRRASGRHAFRPRRACAASSARIAKRLSSILENFSQTAARDLVALQAAQALDIVVEIAHRLKGAARMVGARLLAEQAQGVEHAARAGGLGAAQAAASQLPALLEQTMRVARPALAPVV
jgi:CheY-like chemotaxis protein